MPDQPSAATHPVEIAVAALVDAGRVLLVHRRPGREHYPDCWDLPGGHVEAGEAARDAVRRECREELEIEVRQAAPLPLRSSAPGLRKSAFLVTGWSGTPTNAAPDEHDDLGWFDAEELRRLPLSDPTVLAALESLVARTGPPP